MSLGVTMKTPVAILGATGTVGQKMIKMLENHPSFMIAELAASPRSEGKVYGDHVQWREQGQIPADTANLTLKSLKEITSPFALSALPSDSAKEIEPFLASKGIHIISNASTFRMDKNTPLVIPEINAEHFKMVKNQKTPGKIITNPNCATVFATLGIAPLIELGKINHISIVTLQAISGAGYPGVPSIDILGNIVPNIGGEEEKIETEAQKILGTLDKPAEFDITAHVHRVPVAHGHSVCLHIQFENNVSVDQVKASFKKWQEKFPGLYEIYSDEFSPQPLRDLTPTDQRAHIGRIKQGSRSNIIGLISLGHNLVRGAAGAAILNLEAFQKAEL